MIKITEKIFCRNCGTQCHSDEQFCANCGKEIEVYDTIEFSKELIEHRKGQIQTIATIEIYGGYVVLAAGIVLAFYLLLGIIGSLDDPMLMLIKISMLVMEILIPLFGVLSISSGKKLKEYKAGGYMGTLVISAICIFGFPIGTAAGAYAIYILKRPEVEHLFS